MAEINPIELQKSLKGVAYPASQEDLVRRADEQGADEKVRRALERLPDKRFETPAEVSEAVSNLG